MMKLFSKEATASLDDKHFAFINVSISDHVLYLTLDREQKKNALHPKMMHEIAFGLQHAHYNKDIWMVEIGAKGNVFCAGADLKAMAGFIEPHESTIPDPDDEVLMGELFNQVHKPIIAKVTGDVYAGGFFFLAGCHIVIAQDGVRFGLPEVKRGLYPFQVMAALFRVMPARKVIDWCIRGYNLPVREAERYGLVTQVASADSIEAVTEGILDEIRHNSPTAIRKGLEAYDHIRPSKSEHQYLSDMLKQTIMTKDGQEGLAAFREKRKPRWSGE